MAITAGATAQVGAVAAAVLSSVHPAPAPWSTAFEAADGLSGPDEAILLASDHARVLRDRSSAARWTLDRTAVGDGDGQADEAGLKRAIDEAKDEVVFWRSRTALVHQIAHSVDLGSLLTAVHTEPSHPFHVSEVGRQQAPVPVPGADLLSRVNERDELALAHLRSTIRLKSLKDDLVAVSQDVTDLRRQCQAIMLEIRATSALQSQVAHRGMTPKQTAQLAAYKGRAKSATARREVARNVLQSLIAEGGFDWAGDDELREVMLGLGDASDPVAESNMLPPAEERPVVDGPPPSQDLNEPAVRPDRDA